MDSIVTVCNDGSCCCIPPNGMIAMISIIILVTTTIDAFTSRRSCHLSPHSYIIEHVSSLKALLLTLFQVANVLLLISSIFEIALLVQVYIWYTLGYVVLQLVIVIVDFVFNFYERGSKCLVEFIIEAASMFVLSQCLPLVDIYLSKLEEQSYINSLNG